MPAATHNAGPLLLTTAEAAIATTAINAYQYRNVPNLLRLIELKETITSKQYLYNKAYDAACDDEMMDGVTMPVLDIADLQCEFDSLVNERASLYMTAKYVAGHGSVADNDGRGEAARKTMAALLDGKDLDECKQIMAVRR